MKDRTIIALVLFFTFLVAFFAATLITDTVARANGFYNEGKQAEIGLYE